MTARRRAILIVALALLLIGIIIFAIIYFWPKPVAAPVIAQPAAPTTVGTTPTPAAVQNPLKPIVLAAPAGSTAAAQMAELFAERYGSYSNQGDFQNLKDLLPVMTASYRAKTEVYLATAQPADVANYAGVTSLKISTQVRSYSDSAGTAVIAVTLQQQKSVGASVTPAISYRTLRMALKRAGKDWQVDSAVWED